MHCFSTLDCCCKDFAKPTTGCIWLNYDILPRSFKLHIYHYHGNHDLTEASSCNNDDFTLGLLTMLMVTMFLGLKISFYMVTMVTKLSSHSPPIRGCISDTPLKWATSITCSLPATDPTNRVAHSTVFQEANKWVLVSKWPMSSVPMKTLRTDLEETIQAPLHYY